MKNNRARNKTEWSKKTFNLFVVLAVGGLIFAFYYTILQECYQRNIAGDHIKHINTALSLVDSLKDGKEGIANFKLNDKYSQVLSYPVWHGMTYFLFYAIRHVIPDISMEVATSVAAAFVDALLIMAVLAILFLYFQKRVEKSYQYILTVISCVSLLFVGPLDASKVLENYYLGGYTGNIWHNPTYLAVKPVALMTFLFYSHILTVHIAKKKEYIIASLFLVASAFFKPNFYQCFVPGLVVYCIIYWLLNRTKEVFLECLRIAGTCVPIGVVAVIQFVTSLSGEGGKGIGISYLYVWKHFTPNWKLALIVSIAFPLLVYIIQAVKLRWNVQMFLSLCMLGSAIIQYMFFYIPAGPFAGDFSWGFGLSIFICFMVAMERLFFTPVEGTFSIAGKILCYGIYFMHLYFGILYFSGIWERVEVVAPLRYW